MSQSGPGQESGRLGGPGRPGVHPLHGHLSRRRPQRGSRVAKSQEEPARRSPTSTCGGSSSTAARPSATGWTPTSCGLPNRGLSRSTGWMPSPILVGHRKTTERATVPRWTTLPCTATSTGSTRTCTTSGTWSSPPTSSGSRGCPSPKSAGGLSLAWVDEWWKGAMLVEAVASNENDTDSCGTRTGIPAGRVRVECPAPSLLESNVCGYWLHATFDQYVNEAWFGIHAPSQNTSADYDPLSNPDILTPRKLYYFLQGLWTSTPSPTSSSTGRTTAEQAVGVDLGTAIGFGFGAFFAGACVSAIYLSVLSRNQVKSRRRLFEEGSVSIVESASFEATS